MDPVLVTGSSGLVGYEVARRLHAAGVDVLGVDLRPAPAGTPFPHAVGDIAALDVVAPLLAGRPNVVHAGAVSGPMLMADDPYGVVQANLAGAAAVFEAARQAKIRRLVWTSSIAVYGDQPTLAPVPESARPNPISFYGHSKAAGETLQHGYVTGYGLPAVALRLSSVYGIRRQTASALTAMITTGLAGRPVQVPSEGTSLRQYMHVDDAAEAIVLALIAESIPGFAYNVSGGTYVSEADLARMVAEFVPGLRIEPGPPAWNEGHLGPLLIDAAADDLGYRPRVDLQEGLAELHGHFARHLSA